MTTRFPAQNLSLQPMSQLEDYELVHEDQDVRGWEVRDHDGRLFGRVRDLLIDTKHDRVASLLLDDQSQLSVREVSLGDNVVLIDERASARVAPPSLVAGLSGLGAAPSLDVAQSLTELDVATRVEEIASQAITTKRTESLRPSRRPLAMPVNESMAGDPLGEIALATGIEQVGSTAVAGTSASSSASDSSEPLAEMRLAMNIEQIGSQAIDSQGPAALPPATRPSGTTATRPHAVSAPFIDSSRGGAPALSPAVSEGAPFAEIAMALGVERAASEVLETRGSTPPAAPAEAMPNVTSLTNAPMFFAVDSRREPSSFALPEFDAITTRGNVEPVVVKRPVTLDDEDVIALPDEDVTPISGDPFIAEDYELHYHDNFASTGLPFAQYVPAYGLGHELRVSPTLATHTWEQLEPEAHRVWESRHPGTWEHFKAAVRHGWERLTR